MTCTEIHRQPVLAQNLHRCDAIHANWCLLEPVYGHSDLHSCLCECTVTTETQLNNFNRNKQTNKLTNRQSQKHKLDGVCGNACLTMQ